MPDTDHITIIKRFTYRGATEEWSNSYHLDGTTPENLGQWHTLADAIVASEQPILPSSVQFVRAYGYVAGSTPSVATVDYVALGGTLPQGTWSADGGSVIKAPGDAALTMRVTAAGRSVKGRPIYCRKYFHGVMLSTQGDNAITTQTDAMVAHGARMLAGTLPGGMTWVAPQGAALSNPIASPFVTTRTLKRRGKRP